MHRTPHPRLGRPIAVALLVLLLSACGGPAAEPETVGTATAGYDQALHDRLPTGIRSRGEVRVATDAAYPPANGYAADGRTMEGFEPDLAAALGRVLGVTFTFVRTDFASALPALDSGSVDAVMSAMTDTAERQAHADFVNYFAAGTSILVQRGNIHGISDLHDLCGQTVAVEEGTTQVDLLERSQSSCGDDPIRVELFPDNARALVELRTGRAAAVLNDYPPAARLTTDARTSAHFQLASTTQYEPGFYGIAVRKDQTELRDALREATDRLIRSGEYGEVLQRWGVSSGAVSTATVNSGAHG